MAPIDSHLLLQWRHASFNKYHLGNAASRTKVSVFASHHLWTVKVVMVLQPDAGARLQSLARLGTPLHIFKVSEVWKVHVMEGGHDIVEHFPPTAFLALEVLLA
mmetsp:Transcript_32503/g.92139  ORF Transcript_32503/g.92139 Transcript_32503/m.92139 type:complete len:104 (+) Transcript_32503:6135-6446(+)